METKTYQGKTIAITGGASGIGFALAKRLGQEGANIVIGEPDQTRLDAACEKLDTLNIKAAAQVMDVTDLSSVEAFADFAWNRFETVDVLINNAGIGLPPAPMVKHTAQQARALFDVNLFGVWHGASVFGNRFIEQGSPAEIYNVGSENSFFNAAPGMAAYIASKHAVRGLTEAMREDFPDFVKVALICPGFVRSELTPPPFGELAMDTDEFADKIIAQMKGDGFYIVTHPYNVERIKPVHTEIETAYASNAPRYEGDEEHDVRLLIAKARAQKP